MFFTMRATSADKSADFSQNSAQKTPKSGVRERVATGVYLRHAAGCKQALKTPEKRRRCGCTHYVVQVARGPGSQVTIEAATVSAAKAQREELRKEHRRLAKQRAAGKGETVEEVAADFLRSAASRLAPRSLERLDRDYRRFIDETFGSIEMSTITRPDLMRWYDALVDEDVAASSKRKAIQTFRLLWQHAAARDIVEQRTGIEAFAQMPIRDGDRGEVLTTWTAAQLREAITSPRVLLRHRALIAVMGTGGLRMGEACALRMQDVGTGNDGAVRLQVRGSIAWLDRKRPKRVPAVKTAAARRTVTLPPIASAVVAEQFAARIQAGAGQNDLLFVGRSHDRTREQPLGKTAAGQALGHICTRLGLPRISPHKLRHTAATVAIGAGVPLTELAGALGHTTPATTTRIYAQAVAEREDRPAALAAALARALEDERPSQ
jgi:integrase